MRSSSNRQFYTRNLPHKSSARYSSKSRTIILIIIACAIALVIISASLIYFLDPERRVKSRITTMATDYYENYLYQDNLSSSPSLSKYEQSGFAPITLRQLLLHDNAKNASYKDFLTKYCDSNATRIKIYPVPPYGRYDYYIDYTYSCDF